MKSCAVIIGIDGYKLNPLTSAINDALAVRDKLLKLELVESDNITMLTSPPLQGEPVDEAKCDNIRDCLYKLYSGEILADRLFFYFAGHGFAAYLNSAHTILGSFLMASDVEDLQKDGRNVLSVEEIVNRFRMTGPAEQFYIIDACRNLSWERHPDIPSLGWGAVETDAERRQATLYAVALKGEALAVREGLGVMTQHLLDGLEGYGVALDYFSDTDEYAVTIQSLRKYVCKQIKRELEHEVRLWKRKYQLPQLTAPDPMTKPLRFFPREEIGKREVLFHIEPAVAAECVKVEVTCIRNIVGTLPPNYQHLKLVPYTHWATTTLVKPNLGFAEPQPRKVEPREECDIPIEIKRVGMPQTPPTVNGIADSWIEIDPPLQPMPTAAMKLFTETRSPTLGISNYDIHDNLIEQAPTEIVHFWLDCFERLLLNYQMITSIFIPYLMPVGHLVAKARDPGVTVAVEQLARPWKRRSEPQRLDWWGAPGLFQVCFRQGRDVYSRCEVIVNAYRTVVVSATPAITPLLSELMPKEAAVAARTGGITFSESIGPMQAGALPTLLPLLAIQLFDTQGLIERDFPPQFGALIPRLPRSEWPISPVVVMIGVDGDGWSENMPPEVVLERTVVQVYDGFPPEAHWHSPGSFSNIDLPRARFTMDRPLRDGSVPFRRIGRRIGMVSCQAPNKNFLIELESPDGFGRFLVPATSQRSFITVVAVIVRPDGSFHLSQNLLSLPDEAAPEALELEMSYAQGVRLRQLGQALFEAGELLDPKLNPTAARLLETTWVDPVLSAMAYLALRRLESSVATAARYTIAEALDRNFGSLPDVQVIQAMEHPDREDKVVARLLGDSLSDKPNAVPILAETCRWLAAAAARRSRSKTLLGTIVDTIPIGAIWSLSVQ